RRGREGGTPAGRQPRKEADGQAKAADQLAPGDGRLPRRGQIGVPARAPVVALAADQVPSMIDEDDGQAKPKQQGNNQTLSYRVVHDGLRRSGCLPSPLGGEGRKSTAIEHTPRPSRRPATRGAGSLGCP